MYKDTEERSKIDNIQEDEKIPTVNIFYLFTNSKVANVEEGRSMRNLVLWTQDAEKLKKVDIIRRRRLFSRKNTRGEDFLQKNKIVTPNKES